MPSVKASFKLKDSDIIKLDDQLKRIGDGVEDVVNEHLHTVTGKQMADSITQFIPVSKKGKRHAKHSKWWEQKDYNLGVEISNSIRGKRSFYYLYYVATGTGTSYRNGKRDFMQEGVDKAYDKIVNSLTEKLEEHIERGLK